MVCNYCGKELTSTSVTQNGLNYCNKLCSYLWQKDAETKVELGETEKSESTGIFLQDLDFHINLNNIEGEKLLLRASFFFGPRLFLDGKKLKPYKKVRFYKRKRYYHVPNEKGEAHEIILNLRPLDAIPGLTINGEEVNIVRKLTWYEYALMALPLSLAIIGGMIGGIIGGGAIFTNSILIRKIKHKILRYSMVVINIAVAVLIFYQSILFVTPYFIEFLFKATANMGENSGNVKTLSLTKHIWEVDHLVSDDNPSTPIRSINASWRSYFFSSGEYTQVMASGIFYQGKWKIDADEKFITIIEPGLNEKMELLNISDQELTLRLNKITIYFKAVY